MKVFVVRDIVKGEREEIGGGGTVLEIHLDGGDRKLTITLDGGKNGKGPVIARATGCFASTLVVYPDACNGVRLDCE